MRTVAQTEATICGAGSRQPGRGRGRGCRPRPEGARGRVHSVAIGDTPVRKMTWDVARLNKARCEVCKGPFGLIRHMKVDGLIKAAKYGK